MQFYFAEKIHCVWLADGEVHVLFECKEFEGPDHLGSASIQAIQNKELVQQYLDTMKYIPHIERIITMVPTTGSSDTISTRYYNSSVCKIISLVYINS